MDDSKLTQAIEAIAPATKAARLRSVLPLLQAKLDAGVRLAVLVEIVNAHGMIISKGTLQNYLYRYRKKTREVSRPIVRAAPANASGSESTHAPALGAAFEAKNKVASPVPPSSTVLLHELEQIMHPDPFEQEKEFERYEALGRKLRK